MSDIESSDWSEIAANNIQPAPGGFPANSSPLIVYSNGREDMGAIKRDWDRRNPTVTSGGSANAQTLTFIQGPVAYVQGQTFSFFAGFSNSGATTLNVNGLGAKAIQSNGTALTAGMIIAGSITQVMYDNAGNFQLTLAASGAYLPLAGGTLTGALTISPTAQVILSRPAGGYANILGQTAGSLRWALDIADGSAETGSGNTGSNFTIRRFTDAGAFLDTPLTINRASGAATFADNLVVSPASGPANFVVNAVAGQGKTLWGQTSGVTRWQLMLGNATAESGSNNGSDLAIAAFTDGGASLSTPISIKRSTGVTTFSIAIVNGPSDRSLKENIAPLEDSLDKVLALQGVSFDFIKDETKRRQIGLIAQDVAPIVPEVMQDFIQPDEPPALAIDYTRLVPLLVEAIKELTAKVAALEARLSPETLTA